MSNHTNSSNGKARKSLLALSVGALALVLAFSTVAATSAHAGGSPGGVLGDKSSQGQQGQR